MEISDHLFRHESGRMVSALTRIFGVHNLTLAEDVVQDAFCRAVEVWKLQGVPKNPSAWLMTTAKNRAIDTLRRERKARTFAPELGTMLDSEWTLVPLVEELFAPTAVRDDELRMMFSCCQPNLPEVAQVALVLHLLCGFSVGEVAAAFLTSHAAMEKRLVRAKKTLAASKNLFDIDGTADFLVRLTAVQRSLYLLFNEGYHGACPEFAVREDLCHEAMRLANILLRHHLAATPASYGLASLMCSNAARLPTKVDGDGNLTPLRDQDRSKWDANLLAEGRRLLDVSASGTELSRYHVEAAIAAVHGAAKSTDETDWSEIVALYDTLMAIHPSPVVALSRAIAIGEGDGPPCGLAAIAAIEDVVRLADYPFYSAAMGEFELRRGRYIDARKHFEAAAKLARSPMERRFLKWRAAMCGDDETGPSKAKLRCRESACSQPVSLPDTVSQPL